MRSPVLCYILHTSSSILSSPAVDALEPSALEALNVTVCIALDAALGPIDGRRLLFARMSWDRLFSSANPPGAISPNSAHASLTRNAQRRKHARQKALRSGPIGLLRAIRASP